MCRRFPANGVTIVLDERGQALSSIDLAGKLEAWRDDGKREARFLIGAADGHDEEQRRSLPICCCPSAPPPGRTCWFARCSPSNCSARRRSLRTTPIIAKVRACARSPPCCFASAARGGERAGAAAGDAARRPAAAARAEQAAAETEAARLEQAAAKRAERGRSAARRAGRGGAGYRGRRSADHRRRRAAPLASAYVAVHRQLLAGEQSPYRPLLAGLAVMAQPPAAAGASPTEAAPTNW